MISTFVLMESRKISQTFNLLEEIRKRIEKDFKNSEKLTDKILLTKIGILAECLVKCYNEEREMFLRFDLLPQIKREKLVKKIRKYLFRINEFFGRKRNDSTWRKIGKNTIERSRENNNDAGRVTFSIYLIRL